MNPRMLLTFLLVVGAATLPPTAGAQICPPGYPRVAPDSRYLDHGNGTVTDRQTGLMWKRCSEGQSGPNCSGNPTAMTWQVALQAAASSSFAGHADWRLPSAKELQSLVETGCYSPAINTTFFPNTPPNHTPMNWFWTSTIVASDTSFAWVVSFGSGYVSGNGEAGFLHCTRLVRAGQ